MRRLLLEVIACSVEDAIEAARGGADRLEVARAMDQQGLTPAVSLVRDIAREVRLPLRIMVRETDDFLCDRPGELDRLCERAREFSALAVDGLVLGFARDGALDAAALAVVLEAVPGTRITFHRAFDAVIDPLDTIARLRRFPQVDHVLTGGGSDDWPHRCRRLTTLAARAHPGITVLPGGGVDAAAIDVIGRVAALTEVHVGSAARVPAVPTGRVSADAVRGLRRHADRDR